MNIGKYAYNSTNGVYRGKIADVIHKRYKQNDGSDLKVAVYVVFKNDRRTYAPLDVIIDSRKVARLYELDDWADAKRIAEQ